MNMDTSSYYHALNRPSTSSGYYSQEGYVPNYYQGGEMMTDVNSASSSSSNNMNIYHHQGMDHQMASTYYEPLFRPAPSSCYAHTYSRHNVDPNPSFIAPPPPPTHTGHHTNWYQQHPPVGQHEQMLNMLQFSSSNGREARNKAEKNRRDKLNRSIQELSTMVPHVAESPRRVDKTAVLRFSAHGLRVNYVFGKTINKAPAVKPEVTEALMKMLDTFLLTVTCRGQIVLISPSIEQHLGHCQTDLFGQNILHITHPDDHAMLKKQLIPTDLETLFDVQPEDENGEPRSRTQEEEMEIDRKLSEDRRTFTVRLARAGPRSEPTTYEIVKIDGCFRRADTAPRGTKASTFPSGLQLIRRARGRDDSVPLHSISGNDIVLVAMARVIKPPKICDRLIEANHYEYKTRHLIDGRIIQCDQRISLVAGYMTDEVNGLSPFTFMHQDDVRWVIVALRQMYDCNSAYGESCYRLITRTGKFIYLRTRGYLEIDKDTNKVHSFVCINTLVNEEEGKQRVQEMKNKFSIFIDTKLPQSPIDAPASENPHQLEKAVIYLIKNLQKFEDDEDDDENADVNSQYSGKHHHSGKEIEGSRQSKTPPLAIIPPKTCTIKSSITKSVNVVNITVAKSLKAQQAKSNLTESEEDSREGADGMSDNERRPSVVKKNGDSVSVNIHNGIKLEDDFLSDAVTDDNLNLSESLDNRVPPLPHSEGYFKSDFSGEERTTRYLYSESVAQTSSSLKRTRNIEDTEDEETNVIVKRRNLGESDYFLDAPLDEIMNPGESLTQVLSNSFEELDRSLTNIGNAASELKDQRCSFDITTTTQNQLNEIFEERQEQKEILESIQSEYHAHLQSASIDPTISSIREGTSRGLQQQQNNDFKTR